MANELLLLPTAWAENKYDCPACNWKNEKNENASAAVAWFDIGKLAWPASTGVPVLVSCILNKISPE